MSPLPRGKIRWSNVYKWAGVIHRDVGAMTLWEFTEAVRGYAEANGAKARGTGDISDERLAELGVEGF